MSIRQRGIFVLQAAAALLCSSFAMNARAELPVCTPEFILGTTCEQLEKEPMDLRQSKKMGFSSLQAPGVVLNSYAAILNQNSPELEKFAKADLRSENRAFELAKKALIQAKELIVGDLRKESWSSEQKAMMNRLEKVRPEIVDNDNEICSGVMPLGFPNMGYSPESHTLLICRAAANMTPEHFLLLFTHELGHVVQPCFMDFSFYEISPSASKPSTLRMCFEETIGDDEDQLEEMRTFLGKSHYKATRATPDVERLESCGALKRLAKDHTYPGAPELFKDLVGCLDKSYGPVREQMIKEDAEDSIKTFPRENKDFLRKRAEERAGSLRCFPMHQEHFADAFSAEVTGKILEKSPIDPVEMRASLAEWAGDVCAERKNGRMHSGMYAPAIDRLNTILSHPANANAAGCRAPADSKVCSLTATPPNYSPVGVGGSKSGGKTKSPGLTR